MDASDTAAGANQPPSFADAIRGQAPRPLDRELPSLLQDLYAIADHRRKGTEAPAGELLGTWTRMDDAGLRKAGISPALLHDAKSGFDAALYRNQQGHVVVGYNGTDQGNDWKNSIGQGLGFEDAQYASAIRLAKEAKQAFGNDVVLSGHSLGGGLAAAAAIASDTPAVTYNAAGLNDKTLEREGLDPKAAKAYAEESLIRGYQVKNELLTHLQEDSIPLKWAMPDAAGHQIQLPDPDPLSLGERLIPGKMLRHRLDLHGIESVITSQDLHALDQPDGYQAPASHSAPGHGSQLFRDAVERLEPHRQQLGLRGDAAFFNTAVSVAARAGADGLDRIDHLVLSRNCEGLFAVQGGMNDPAHRRSYLDAAQASATPAQHSVGQLQEQHQGRSPQAPEHEVSQRQRTMG